MSPIRQPNEIYDRQQSIVVVTDTYLQAHVIKVEWEMRRGVGFLRLELDKWSWNSALNGSPQALSTGGVSGDSKDRMGLCRSIASKHH